MPIISAPLLLLDGALSGPAAVVIEGDRIVEVRDGRPAASNDHLALGEGILSPGLIDLQVNGAFGIDFIAAEAGDWETIAATFPATGVTSFQPTFTTAPIDTLVGGLRRAAAARERLHGRPFARLLGVHVEGPFLSPARAGVHPTEHMLHPLDEHLDALLADDAAAAAITMLTLAPELPGATAAIKRLVARGIRVSMGHTDATAAQVRRATDAGACMVTHIFNAQRGLGHREPGVAGQALADERLIVGLIADLMHVSGEIVAVTMRAAAGRVALVTDSIAAAGMPPGHYVLGDILIDVGEDGLPRDGAGAIAGSTLTLDCAVRNVVAVGVGPAAALHAATRVPADLIGRTDLGRIEVGALADLVWLSDDLRPQRTWVGGRPSRDASGVKTFESAGAPVLL